MSTIEVEQVNASEDHKKWLDCVGNPIRSADEEESMDAERESFSSKKMICSEKWGCDGNAIPRCEGDMFDAIIKFANKIHTTLHAGAQLAVGRGEALKMYCVIAGAFHVTSMCVVTFNRRRPNLHS